MTKYRLNDIAPIQQGKIFASGTYWLLNLDMVESNTGQILDYLYVAKKEIGASTVAFDTSNVLYSKLRPYLNKVVIPDRPGYATSEMLPLRPNINIITREYLAYFLRSPHFVAYINGKTSGAKMPRANSADLKAVEIDCPTIERQNIITAMFKAAEAIIYLRQQQLQKLDYLIKARFVEMFGNPINNTQHRPTKELIEVVTMQRGFDLPVQDRKQEGTIPVYGSNGPLDRHNIAKVCGGGIITGRSGTIGNVYYTHGDFWPLNTTLFSADTHGNNIVFLAVLLQLFNLTRFIEGTGVPTLNRNVFHDKPIIDVPLGEQNQFASFVAQVDEIKAIVQQSLEETQCLLKSMMYTYFD